MVWPVFKQPVDFSQTKCHSKINVYHLFEKMQYNIDYNFAFCLILIILFMTVLSFALSLCCTILCPVLTNYFTAHKVGNVFKKRLQLMYWINIQYKLMEAILLNIGARPLLPSLVTNFASPMGIEIKTK